MFHYLRPHELLEQYELNSSWDDPDRAVWDRIQASIATIRRAIIMAAVIIAISLGA